MDISFYRITNREDACFKPSWSLYQEAFPLMERREIVLQNQLFNAERYHFDVVKSGATVLGFILWWQFEHFVYIEHLATIESVRGQGVGERIVTKLKHQTGTRLVLEVEPPTTKINQRRIGFYERLGFVLNDFPYQQLPLRKNGTMVDLLLMSYPDSLDSEEFVLFKDEFKKHCYSPFADYLE